MARAGGVTDGEGPRLGGAGFSIVEKARDAIESHEMLDGGTVVVAVSGGPDSSCLLDVLARLSDTLEITPVVAHVDHGLRAGSEEVAAAVSTSAARAGFDVHVIRAPDLSGSNLHARARDFRYGFFESIADQVDAGHIATGHTLDDRVETTLARLIHGAGTEGLAGLRPVDGRRIRPLIEVRRSETRAYCEERGIDFVDDPGNDDLRFERNAVRAEVVSAIESRWGEGAVRAMATSATRLAEDSELLADLAETLYVQLAKGEEGNVTFDRAAFDPIGRGLRRRLLERAVGRVRDRSGGIDEVLDALDRTETSLPARFAVVSGIEVVITRESVEVKR